MLIVATGFGDAHLFRGTGPGVAGFGGCVMATLALPPSTPGYVCAAPSAREKVLRESPAGHRGVVVNFVGGMVPRGSLHSVTPFSFMGLVPG